MAGAYEAAEPFDVQVEQPARLVINIAIYCFRGLEHREAVEPGARERATHRALCHAESLADLAVGPALALQLQDARTDLRRGLVRAAVRAR